MICKVAKALYSTSKMLAASGGMEGYGTIAKSKSNLANEITSYHADGRKKKGCSKPLIDLYSLIFFSRIHSSKATVPVHHKCNLYSLAES